MRAFFLWTIVRAAVFWTLDALFIHDATTSLAFFGAFTLIAIVIADDERRARLRLTSELRKHEEDRHGRG